MPDNSNIQDVELREMADQIEADMEGGRHGSVSALQALYLDRVYEKRQLAAEDLVNDACLYIGDPDVARQLPSLMDACDGDPASAAKYVVWYMMVLEDVEEAVSFLKLVAAIPPGVVADPTAQGKRKDILRNAIAELKSAGFPRAEDISPLIDDCYGDDDTSTAKLKRLREYLRSR